MEINDHCDPGCMYKCGEYNNTLDGLVCIVFNLDSNSLSFCYNLINLTKLAHPHPLVYNQPLSYQLMYHLYVVPPQSWGDRSDTKHSECFLLGGQRLNQLTLIPKPKGSGGARAATAQVGPANKRNDTKRCLPVEASLRPGEAVPW